MVNFSAGPELLDSSGQPLLLRADHWYRIKLADGKELGIDGPGEWVKVYPAGQGMVVRLSSAPKGRGSDGQTWLSSGGVYFRGCQIEDAGTQLVRDISMSGWSTPDNPPKQKWMSAYASTSTDGYPFRAEPIFGNRLLLYGDADQTRGLGVTSANYVIGSPVGNGQVRIGLDVAFVRVGGQYAEGAEF